MQHIWDIYTASPAFWWALLFGAICLIALVTITQKLDDDARENNENSQKE